MKWRERERKKEKRNERRREKRMLGYLPERILYVYVTIERDRAKIQNRGSAAHNVEGDPSVAESRPEYPIAEEIVHPGKSHNQTTDEKIGDSEGGQE